MAVVSVSYEIAGWGVGRLWGDAGRVVHHELPRPFAAPAGPPRASTHFERNDESRTGGKRNRDEAAPLFPLIERIEEYFAGRRVDFAAVDVDLDGCTPFQRAIASVLLTVEYGSVVTYGELAALAGYPNAHRAAGTFCARNRFPLVFPCHRVVACGALGSFGELGTAYKRRLLALEHVAL